MFKAIAFESIKHKGKYISDGPDVPTMDANGLTDVLEESLLVIRIDLKDPVKRDLSDFYEFISDVPLFNYESFRKNAKPIDVKLTKKQLKVIITRNEW